MARSRSRSEMFVLDSVNTTAKASAAAITVTIYTTTSMILKLSEKSLATFVELFTLTNASPAVRRSASSIFCSSVPVRLANSACLTHGSP